MKGDYKNIIYVKKGPIVYHFEEDILPIWDKYLLPTSEGKQFASITKTKRLMLFREIIINLVRNEQNINTKCRKSFIFLITRQLVGIFKFHLKQFTSLISTRCFKRLISA
jgi:hypothetical protein